MKSTGVVRKVDELGRVVVPIELRRTLGIDVKDSLEIFVDGDKLILQKYVPAQTCIITGEISDNNVTIGEGKGLCISREGALRLMDELKTAYEF